MRILIATHPFGETGRQPLDLMKQTGWDLVFNPTGRRLKAAEVRDLLPGIHAVIAGTEPYNADTLARASDLKVIARVGIGLDNVDLDYCRARGIRVTYTPDAPSDGVAELTLGMILNLIRHMQESDRSVRAGAWNRLMGVLVRELTIGVIGAGRIGSRIIALLQPFQPTILAYDVDSRVYGRPLPNTRWCGLEDLLRGSDLVTVHIPLDHANRHLINRERLALMPPGAWLVNTSRGPIVDEGALVEALRAKHLGGAALDVFEKEPYEGPLASMENVILTAHMGASARESRFRMESDAAQDCIRTLRGETPAHDAIADTFGPSRASPEREPTSKMPVPRGVPRT